MLYKSRKFFSRHSYGNEEIFWVIISRNTGDWLTKSFLLADKRWNSNFGMAADDSLEAYNWRPNKDSLYVRTWCNGCLYILPFAEFLTLTESMEAILFPCIVVYPSVNGWYENILDCMQRYFKVYKIYVYLALCLSLQLSFTVVNKILLNKYFSTSRVFSIPCTTSFPRVFTMHGQIWLTFVATQWTYSLMNKILI